MTIKEAKILIKSFGLTLVRKAEYNEFQVKVMGRPETTYFTDDLNDAIQTAKCMAETIEREKFQMKGEGTCERLVGRMNSNV